MFNNLFQSLHESVKKRNTPDAFILDAPKDVNVIHRGYIKNAAFPLKYDFLPKEEGKSKNEGTSVYRFNSGRNTGIIEVNHRVNSSMESGHETTSSFSHELSDIESDINLRRTILPAVDHHIRSHTPDILKFQKGFKFLKEIIEKIDPDGKIYDIKKSDTGTTLKKKAPVDEKTKRIISHIKTKLTINKNKEKHT